MKFLRILIISLGQTILFCSLLTPEHQFTNRIRLSPAPGTGATDTAAVYAILEANDLPDTLFSSIVEIGEDLRVVGLNLSGRDIDTLPPVIGELASLGRLDLSENRLASLPESITRLYISMENIDEGWRPVDNYLRENPVFRNGLNIDNNMLCVVSDSVAKWLDWHFATVDYLAFDTTQQCEDR